jgi:hypothetical protein
LPELPFRITETSRNARAWSLMASNWPALTDANAVYSASVAKIHG